MHGLILVCVIGRSGRLTADVVLVSVMEAVREQDDNSLPSFGLSKQQLHLINFQGSTRSRARPWRNFTSASPRIKVQLSVADVNSRLTPYSLAVETSAYQVRVYYHTVLPNQAWCST